VTEPPSTTAANAYSSSRVVFITTEFVIVGLLPTVATDPGITLPSAGLLVSLYALGVAIGAPVLTALIGKLPRKALLLGLMALFTAGNLLAWQAPGYETLVAARILTASRMPCSSPSARPSRPARSSSAPTCKTGRSPTSCARLASTSPPT